jgi:hypothetical protein
MEKAQGRFHLAAAVSIQCILRAHHGAGANAAENIYAIIEAEAQRTGER